LSLGRRLVCDSKDTDRQGRGQQTTWGGSDLVRWPDPTKGMISCEVPEMREKKDVSKRGTNHSCLLKSGRKGGGIENDVRADHETVAGSPRRGGNITEKGKRVSNCIGETRDVKQSCAKISRLTIRGRWQRSSHAPSLAIGKKCNRSPQDCDSGTMKIDMARRPRNPTEMRGAKNIPYNRKGRKETASSSSSGTGDGKFPPERKK